MISFSRPLIQFRPISGTRANPSAACKIRAPGSPANIGGGLLALLMAYAVHPPAGQMAATSNDKFAGNLIKLTTTVGPDSDTYWNQITPENSGKWLQVERTRDVMNWRRLDFACNCTRTVGIQRMPFKLHTLVWGQSYPTWMDSLPENEQREKIKPHTIATKPQRIKV